MPPVTGIRVRSHARQGRLTRRQVWVSQRRSTSSTKGWRPRRPRTLYAGKQPIEVVRVRINDQSAGQAHRVAHRRATASLPSLIVTLDGPSFRSDNYLGRSATII